MSDHLDDALRALAASGPDHELGGLERDVWAGVRRHAVAARATRAMAPVSVAAVLMASGFGVAAGTIAAGTNVHDSAGGLLAMSTPLAPSRLLEGG